MTYRDARPRAEWVYFASRRYTEPFFTDTVRQALRSPFARTFRHQGPLAPCSGMAPSGFIFHMSRCGSTLISQMLAALDRVLVISEAPAIDDVLHAEVHVPGIREDEQVQWLRAVVSALGQAQAGQELYFIKLDAWHIHKLPLLHSAFPATPWIFVYRDPIEVLVSQLRTPASSPCPALSCRPCSLWTLTTSPLLARRMVRACPGGVLSRRVTFSRCPERPVREL